MRPNYRTFKHPGGNDIIHAAATYGLADIHDHSFPRPGVTRFWATAYGGAYTSLGTAEYEAEFTRDRGIRITPVTSHTN
jgi:hypothetical protein